MSEFLELEAQDGIRMPWNVIPGTKQEAVNCVIPVSAIYTPLKSIPDMPVLPYSPLRCRMCRSVLNPFAIVDYVAKIWVCPFCFQRNQFPQHYSSVSENNLPAELFPQYTTVEYMASTETGPAVPPVFIFVVDTCMIEEEIGYLKPALAQAVELLPDNSLVGCITFGTYVQVYELGFGLLPKSYVFKGTKEVTKEQILEQMCFFAGKKMPTTGVIAGTRDGLSSESIARFLLPASECEFVLNSVIEEMQRDPCPVPADQRASRCTGAALSVAANLLGVCVPGSGGRIMAFVGDPSTEGPGSVSIEELNHILTEVNAHILHSSNELSPITTIAGGSVANTIRGLSAGFGISTGIIGACGDDNQGVLFVNNMSFSGVDLTRLRAKKGHTAQCACLVDASGNRTMRPCLSTAVKLQASDFRKEDFKGSKWLVVRYAQQNMEQITEAIRIAKQEGLLVSLDLASFEMVRDYRLQLIELLETGNIDLCFANEDEARELIGGGLASVPEEALTFLGKYCKWAVVTLASKGCMAKHGNQVVQVPATGESNAVDATGAGDLFASGFLYGLVKGLPLEECCKVGACSGGSVTRALGGEVRPENWQWMYKQMHARGLLLPDLKN